MFAAFFYSARSLFCLLYPHLGIAVDAPVDLLLPIHQFKYMRDLLLAACDAPRIFAVQHIRQPVRQRQVLLFQQLPVLDVIDRDVGIKIPKHIQVQVDELVDLDDILFAVLCAAHILDDC